MSAERVFHRGKDYTVHPLNKFDYTVHPSKPGASLPTEVDRKWAAGRRCCSIFGLHYIPAERILTLVVSTLAEIEKAVPLLEIADLSNLERFVRAVRLRRHQK